MSVLTNKTIAVSIVHRSWTGTKYDNKQRSNLHKQFGLASQSTFNVTKNLFGGQDDLLKEIRAIGKHCREVSKFYCVGQLSEGVWILPYALLFKHEEKVKALKEKHDALVKKFCDTFSTRVADAIARSNGAVSEEDFPSYGEIKNKFELDVQITAVPSVSALDKILGEDQKEVVKKATDDLQKKIDESVANVFSRIHTTLEDLIGIAKPQGFRESSLNKIENLVNILPELNFSSDKRISEIADSCAEFVKKARSICSGNAGYCADTMAEVKKLATSLNMDAYNKERSSTVKPVKRPAIVKKTKQSETVIKKVPTTSKTKMADMTDGIAY